MFSKKSESSRPTSASIIAPKQTPLPARSRCISAKIRKSVDDVINRTKDVNYEEIENPEDELRRESLTFNVDR